MVSPLLIYWRYQSYNKSAALSVTYFIIEYGGEEANDGIVGVTLTRVMEVVAPLHNHLLQAEATL